MDSFHSHTAGHEAGIARPEQERWDENGANLESADRACAAELRVALQRSERDRIRLAMLNAALLEVNRRLLALATTDEKTGLPNYRRFRERLQEEFARHLRTGAPLALLLLDVDRFKRYNDSFGHPAGDEALCQIARIIRQSIRDMDMAARYGGEEFAALLPGSDANAALHVADRIRAAVSAYSFDCCPLTISVGVSDLAIAGRNVEALIVSADEALYTAKEAGRNRVSVALRAG
jgi:diguanylate cyclase (GGDEF)-like protein